MKNIILSTIAALAMVPAVNAQQVTVYPGQPTGPVKNMNSVNNPPTKGRIQAVKNLKTPYMRNHDAALYRGYGGQFAVDISGVFPDFSKNVNDPASYQFAETDYILKNTLAADMKIFFRLGQSIENNFPVKHFVYPPKDFKKWAQICEHIIRHYNEGWADGYKWNIEYWEIWNEPDLDQEKDIWKNSPRTWGGTPEQFNQLFEITAKHLRKCFPDIKIGGPAWASMVSKRSRPMVEGFLKYMSEHNVRIDFISYHKYSHTVESMERAIDNTNALLDQYGYGSLETWLNEWNYVRSFSETNGYSAGVRSSVKGAAFAAAVMSSCQYKRIDNLMYYDIRPMTSYNGVFNDYSPRFCPAYYALYAWRKISDLGTAVKVERPEKNVYAAAAIGKNGRTGILVSCFNDDDNVDSNQTVTINVDGMDNSITEVFGHVTDSWRLFTETPLTVKDGTIKVIMEPNSFIYIEF